MFAVCGAAEGCDADGIVLVENEYAFPQVCQQAQGACWSGYRCSPT
ncbi:hypothetical protein ACFYPN_16935 [Streptomyces sp. NPDC005576]